MITESLRSYYLHKMGIPVWYASRSLPGARPDRLLVSMEAKSTRSDFLSATVSEVHSKSVSRSNASKIASTLVDGSKLTSPVSLIADLKPPAIDGSEPLKVVSDTGEHSNQPIEIAATKVIGDLLSVHWLWWKSGKHLFISEYSGAFSLEVESNLLSNICNHFGSKATSLPEGGHFCWPVFANRQLPLQENTEIATIFLKALNPNIFSEGVTVVAMGKSVAEVLLADPAPQYGAYPKMALSECLTVDLFFTHSLSETLAEPVKKRLLWRQLAQVFSTVNMSL